MRCVRRCTEAPGSPPGCSPQHAFNEPLYDLAPSVTLPSPVQTEQDSTIDHADLEILDTLRAALDGGKVLVVAGPRPAAACRTPHGTLEVNLPALRNAGRV